MKERICGSRHLFLARGTFGRAFSILSVRYQIATLTLCPRWAMQRDNDFQTVCISGKTLIETREKEGLSPLWKK